MATARLTGIKRKLQYFRINAFPGKDAGLFGEKLKAICENLSEDQREYNYQGTQVRLDLLMQDEKDGLVRGLVQQIRNNAPSKRRQGRTESTPIELGTDEGINEKTHFIYDPESSLICVEHNYHGPKISLIVRVVDQIYKENIEKHERRNSFEYIQTKQAVKHVKEQHNVRSVIAKYTDPYTVATDTEAELPEVLSKFKAPENMKLEVKLTSTVRGGIAMKISDFTNLFLKEEKQLQLYEKLVVDVEEDETGKSKVFDLIKDKLEDEVLVAFKQGTQEVDAESILEIIKEHFAKVQKKYIINQ